MKYRKLGKTGLEVSEIGFGTWAIGGLTPGQTSYGHTDDTVSLDALREAFALGINFFDTANIYGNGHSEELLGQAFQRDRSEVIIASKCGFKSLGSEHDFSEKAIRDSVETSLRRLKTDYIDLLQVHDPPPNIADNEEVVETLRSLRFGGKISAIGVSVKSPADGLRFLKYPWESIQCNFNMIDQRALSCGLLDKALASNIGIIARTPLAFGFLSGVFTDQENIKFPDGDHRARWPKEQIRLWADAPKYFAKLNEDTSRTSSQLALKFCISFDAVATTICGITNPIEARENSSVSDLSMLSPEEIAGIIRIEQENQFFIK